MAAGPHPHHGGPLTRIICWPIPPRASRERPKITGQVPPSLAPRTERDVNKEFVYKHVPHVTLKSIANNEGIDAIDARSQEKLEPNVIPTES